MPEKDIDVVPVDYSLMTANGFGKAKLHLFENSDAMDIHKAIIDQFPKLSDCGGYELLRMLENTKRSNILTPPVEGYTGLFLKKVFGQAKCYMYIRPLQHDIVMQKCPALISGVEVN